DSARTDVADLDRSIFPELPLHVQVPVEDVRRAEVAVDGEDVAGCAGGEGGVAIGGRVVDRAGHGPGPARTRHGGCCGDDVPTRRADVRSAGGDDIETGSGSIVDAVLAQEHGQVRDLIGHAEAGADLGLAIAPGIPDQTYTRSEVVVIAFIGVVDL